jgi:hypothetical protein
VIVAETLSTTPVILSSMFFGEPKKTNAKKIIAFGI